MVSSDKIQFKFQNMPDFSEIIAKEVLKNNNFAFVSLENIFDTDFQFVVLG